jgi:tetratricopeptide (TPR) repeat protein
LKGLIGHSSKDCIRRGGLASTRLLLGAVVVLLLLSGCSSSEERQAKYFARAQELMAEGDYAKAKLEVRNVLQINENHVQARYLWALLLEREQNYRQMFANLQLAVDLDPDYIDARVKLGQTYYRAQQYERAMEQAEAVLELEPESPDGLTLYGSVLYRRGDNDGAVEAANRALVAAPGHVGAISIITEVYKQSEPQRALAVIGDGIQQQSRDATLKMLEISVYKAQGEDESVIQGYRSLMQDYPENLFYHYQLVTFLEERERIEEAEGILRDIVKTKPDNTQLKLWLAEFLANQRNLQVAESTVKEFIEREPGLFELRFALGKIYESLGNFEDARLVYDEVISLDVDGADSLLARNRKIAMLMRDFRVDEAETMVEEVLAIEAENTNALITKARILVGRAEYQEAVALLRTVTKNEPDNVLAWVRLGEANALRGATDLAVDNYKSALALRPAQVAALQPLYALLSARGDSESAREYINAAAAAAPTSVAIKELAFKAALSAKDYDTANLICEWFANHDGADGAEYQFALIALSQNDIGQARKYLIPMVNDGNASWAVVRDLINTYTSLPEQGSALSLLADARETNPENPFIVAGQAVLIAKQGDLDRAEQLYQESMKIRTNLTALEGLVSIAFSRQQPERAVELVRAAEPTFADSPQFLLTKAQTYEEAGYTGEAVTTYERFLMLRPSSMIAANNLAMLLLTSPTGSKQDKLSALPLTDRFIGSNNASFLDTRGRALLEADNYAEAVATFSKAVSIGGNDVVDQMLMAKAQEALSTR